MPRPIRLSGWDPEEYEILKLLVRWWVEEEWDEYFEAMEISREEAIEGVLGLIDRGVARLQIEEEDEQGFAYRIVVDYDRLHELAGAPEFRPDG